jgi:hypothetical protein
MDAGSDVPVLAGIFGGNQSIARWQTPRCQLPEACIGAADKLFDQDGKLANDGSACSYKGSSSAPSGPRPTPNLG